jgi:DNA-binding FadR family transcriptional regulator
MPRLKKRSFRRGRLSEQVVAELEKLMVEEYPAGARLPKESDWRIGPASAAS